jgi:hypothetical protein
MDGFLIMPANKYTKSLYKSGTVKGERMAEMLRERAKSPMPKEGTTNPSGGRPAVKMPAKPAAAKPQKAISLTVRMKPTPMGKKK